MHLIADALLGRPYVVAPLIGDASSTEQLVLRTDAFDCVTFVETVVALARSSSPAGFERELRRLRYRAGEVEWRSRLHYFSDWLSANAHRRALRLDTRGAGAKRLSPLLAILPSFSPRRANIWVLPKRQLRQGIDRLEHGSVVAFASTKSRLDYFHVGLVFRVGRPDHEDEIWLYHSAKSAGGVVREPLEAFLKRHRMRGITFAAVLAQNGRSR